MRIRTKLIAIFGTAIVVVAAVAGTGVATYHRLIEEGRAQQTLISAEAAQAVTRLEVRQNAAERTLGVEFVVVLLLVGVGCFVAMHYLILTPLDRVVNDINAASEGISEGRGDLTHRLAENSADEFGALGRCFNAYVSRMQEIIRETKRSSVQLSAAAEEMSAVTDESRRSVQQQQSEVEQVATAMNEMTSTVQEVARSTALAAETARNADEKTRHGIEAVTQAIEMIDDLAQEVRGAADAVRKLEEESAGIGKVVDVIRGIAEQTNLLALNAAIEAARAGEQGRGFAVVADEVRVLASRTQNSTREIHEMIQRLQNNTSEAAQVMLRGNQQAKVCVREAGKGASVLADISGAVSTISDMNTQIASAAEEQGAVAEEINRNVVNISQIAAQTASGSDQIASAGKELVTLAVRLQGLVGSFKV